MMHIKHVSLPCTCRTKMVVNTMKIIVDQMILLHQTECNHYDLHQSNRTLAEVLLLPNVILRSVEIRFEILKSWYAYRCWYRVVGRHDQFVDSIEVRRSTWQIHRVRSNHSKILLSNAARFFCHLFSYTWLISCFESLFNDMLSWH